MPLCFDLDGTLGSFSGGYLLLREALQAVWGWLPSEDDLRRCGGSTDWEIVDELHRQKFGTPLSADGYAAYDRACLERFQATFHPEGRRPAVHRGLVQGMTLLLEEGYDLWLVSGNTPRILAFKAMALGVDPRIRQLGSLPGYTRAQLIQLALDEAPPPHLYVGDRAHDHEAANAARVPFLGVGEAAPEGGHPVLSPDSEAAELVAVVRAILG
mgnify:CR=1 FL=1